MVDTKTCTHCKSTKSLDEYHKNKNTRDGHDTLCRTCRITKTRIQYEINRAVVMEAKYKPCHCCGRILDPADIDLHHLDPKKKKYNIASGISSRSRKSLLKEIKKCVPVCRPCHREIHHGVGRSGK